MEVKFHFGLQRDKNDLQKGDDRLLFYALQNSEDQVVPRRCPLFFFFLLEWLILTFLSIINAHPDLLEGWSRFKTRTIYF